MQLDHFSDNLIEQFYTDVDIRTSFLPTEDDIKKVAKHKKIWTNDQYSASVLSNPKNIYNRLRSDDEKIRYFFAAALVGFDDLAKILKANLEKRINKEAMKEITDWIKKNINMILPYVDKYTKEEAKESEEMNAQSELDAFTGGLTEAVEKHNELNSKLWEDNKLKPEVKEKIDLIVEEFLDGLKEDEIKFKLDDAWLTGSNASFNWTKNSDLDVHLLFDLSIYTDEEKQAMADLLYSYYTKNWRNKLTITIYGIPVELYIETNYEK